MSITPEGVRNLLNEEKIFVLDVRRPDELAEGHLKTKRFLNIPHSAIGDKFNLSDAEFLV